MQTAVFVACAMIAFAANSLLCRIALSLIQRLLRSLGLLAAQ